MPDNFVDTKLTFHSMSTDQQRRERKRQQNKLSQRKHRARQTERIADLENEVANLRAKLTSNETLRDDKDLVDVLVAMRAKVADASRALTEIDQILDRKITELGRERSAIVYGIRNQVSESLRSVLPVADILELDDSSPSESEVTTINRVGVFTPGSVPQFPEVTPYYSNDDKAVVPISNIKQTPLPLGLFNTESFVYPSIVPSLPSFAEYSIRGTYNNIESNFYNSLSVIPHVPAPERIVDPTFINLLASYAEQILVKLPKLQSFTLAIGGYHWICGQLLVIVFERQDLRFIRSFLFDDGKSTLKDEFHHLKERLIQELEIRLSLRPFNNYMMVVSSALYIEYSRRAKLLFPSYFKPTSLQEYYIEHKIPYNHLINFFIWPEMRDALLRNYDRIKDSEFTIITQEVMDNIVVKLRGENLLPWKIFYILDLIEAISLDCNYRVKGFGQEQITLKELIAASHPDNWRLTRSFGYKFKDLVPENLILHDIDDRDENYIIRPALL